jgi:hypothetical protein
MGPALACRKRAHPGQMRSCGRPDSRPGNLSEVNQSCEI